MRVMTMTPRRLCIASTVACALSLTTLAGPTGTAPAAATQPQQQDLESLITALSSDSGAARQRAQDRLIELGMSSREVEARLGRLARESRDEEAVARAQAALRMIAEQRVVGPALVTLHLRGADPRDAFEQLAAQAGIEIGAEPPEMWKKKGSATPVTLDADGRPFWEVFRELCRQSGVEPDFSDNGRLKLIESPDGKWAATPAIVRGPLLIRAERITETRSLEFGAPGNGEQSRELTLSVYLEPKLRILHDTFTAGVDAAQDDQRRSLLPDEPGDNIELTNVSNSTRQWEVGITLTCPPAGGGKQIAMLKGQLRVMAAVKLQPIEIPDVLAATEVSRTVAGRRLVLHRARKVKGGYEAQVTLFRDGLTDPEWQQFASPQDFVRLVDAKDRPILFTSISETESNDKQARLTLQFENPNNMPNGIGGPVGKPAKLVWDVPAESKELKVPFEFKDLRLP